MLIDCFNVQMNIVRRKKREDEKEENEEIIYFEMNTTIFGQTIILLEFIILQ